MLFRSTLIISADIENQINELAEDEKKNYMDMIGLKDTGLSMLIQKGYKILELDTYFTSGPEETRAWTIQKNCTAPKAAGEIHTDFATKFIKAEIYTFDDAMNNKEKINELKTMGLVKMVGRDYIMQEGDIAYFIKGQ